MKYVAGGAYVSSSPIAYSVTAIDSISRRREQSVGETISMFDATLAHWRSWIERLKSPYVNNLSVGPITP